MNEKVLAVKAAVAGAVTALSVKIGWVGWLIIIYASCMMADMVTGWCKALKLGKWTSEKARAGLWHKAGAIFAIAASGGLDLMIGLIIKNIPMQLPFNYTVLIFPLALVWYTLTEMGSIIENAGELGAPVPKFLKKCIAVLKNAADAAGDSLTKENK